MPNIASLSTHEATVSSPTKLAATTADVTLCFTTASLPLLMSKPTTKVEIRRLSCQWHEVAFDAEIGLRLVEEPSHPPPRIIGVLGVSQGPFVWLTGSGRVSRRCLVLH